MFQRSSNHKILSTVILYTIAINILNDDYNKI